MQLNFSYARLIFNSIMENLLLVKKLYYNYVYIFEF